MVRYLLGSNQSLEHLPEWWATITTPSSRAHTPIREGRPFAIDNEAYVGKFDPDRFRAYLEKMQPHRSRCYFAAAPDVRLDAAATLALYPAWRDTIRSLGYPVALVAQDGMTPAVLRHADPDALFVGGSDTYRHSRTLARMSHAARAAGLHVHFGRVNSLRMIRHAHNCGAHTVDGNHAAYAGLGPTVAHFDPLLREIARDSTHGRTTRQERAL